MALADGVPANQPVGFYLACLFDGCVQAPERARDRDERDDPDDEKDDGLEGVRPRRRPEPWLSGCRACRALSAAVGPLSGGVGLVSG